MSRTPQEIFTAHVTALSQGDVPAIMKDYSDDAVLISQQGVLEGRAAIEQFFTQVIAALPDPQLTATSATFGGDVLLLLWTAKSRAGTISDGVDTFIFANDEIKLQTTHFTFVPSA